MWEFSNSASVLRESTSGSDVDVTFTVDLLWSSANISNHNFKVKNRNGDTHVNTLHTSTLHTHKERRTFVCTLFTRREHRNDFFFFARRMRYDRQSWSTSKIVFRDVTSICMHILFSSYVRKISKPKVRPSLTCPRHRLFIIRTIALHAKTFFYIIKSRRPWGPDGDVMFGTKSETKFATKYYVI